MTEPATAEELRKAADEVEVVFANMLEAGLFHKKAERYAEKTLKELKAARECIVRGKITAANDRILHARLALQNAIHVRARGWRLVHVHQAQWFLYHIIVGLLVLNVATGWLNGVLAGLPGRLLPSVGIADTIWGVPIQALGFGALGGTLRGIYWLHRQVSGRLYRVHFGMSHFAAPWIGGLFGIFVYLAVQAGLMVLGNGDAALDDGSAGVWALTFLAGYNWQWALSQMDRLRERAAGGADEETPEAEEEPTEEEASDEDAVKKQEGDQEQPSGDDGSAQSETEGAPEAGGSRGPTEKEPTADRDEDADREDGKAQDSNGDDEGDASRSL